VAEDPKVAAIRRVLEQLTGKKIKVTSFAPVNKERSGPNIPAGKDGAVAPSRQGWGLEYDYHERYEERESLQFTAKGQVETTDGRVIDFQLVLSMARQFIEETSLSIRAGDALIDPLIINFGGNAPELTDWKFDFDLDMNEVAEQISFVGKGSGFLFFDRNQDGIVNNGGELFGPATGSGFNELARLDHDGNGWMDENDPLFAELQIWMKDTAGNDYFARLPRKILAQYIFLRSIRSSP
jgi:hypothetical protein